MRFPDRKELAGVMILTLGLTTIGACSQVPVEATPTARPVPAAPKIPTATASTLVPDKKALRKQLASLDLSKAPGERLELGKPLNVGSIVSILSNSAQSEVYLNRARLAAFSDECKFPETGRNFNVELTDGQESSFSIDGDKNRINATFGIRRVYAESLIDLRRSFELEQTEMIKALENLANIHMNRLLVEGTCGAALAARRSQTLTQGGLMSIMQEISKISSPYANRLLTGTDVPVLRTSPKLKSS